MKQIFITMAAGSFLFFSCNNQPQPHNVTERTSEHEEKIFRQAKEYGDLQTAIFAVHSMLAFDSTQNHLNDTLARLYYGNGQYFEALYAAEKVLENNPDNADMMEIVAITHQSMGRHDLALQTLRRLYSKEQKVDYLYKMAVTQVSMNQIEEAFKTIDEVFAHPDVEQDSIEILMGQGMRQQVLAKAAAFNLKGLTLLQQAQEYEATRNFQAQERVVREARTNFQEALKIEPEFMMAATYLNELNKILGR